MVQWSAENEGLGQQGKPSKVTVTTRPYKKQGQSSQRHQVDIMIAHPASNEIIRRRHVAPAGYDAVAAKAWGEGKVKDILRDLFRAAGKPRMEAPAEPVETRQPTIETRAKSPEVPSLGELWERHAKTVKNPGSRRTRECEWKAIAAICESCPANAWDKQKSVELEAVLEQFGPGYGNHCLSLLRKLLLLGVSDGVLEEVPRLPAPRSVRAPDLEDAHSLEDGEELLRIARQLGSERGEDWELLLLLGLDAGLRPGEVAGLRWIDVEWKRGCLHVRNQRPRAGASDRAPKTGESRKVFTTARLMTRLKARLEVCRVREEDSPYVLSKSGGEPLYTQAVSDRVARIHVAVGLGGPRRRGHHLRHCSASWSIDAGATLTQVQAHLGHKRASTTEAYIHQVKGSQPAKEAAAILDRVHGGNAPATSGNASAERQEKAM